MLTGKEAEMKCLLISLLKHEIFSKVSCWDLGGQGWMKHMEVSEEISIIFQIILSIKTLGFGNNIFYHVKWKFPIKQVIWASRHPVLYPVMQVLCHRLVRVNERAKIMNSILHYHFLLSCSFLLSITLTSPSAVSFILVLCYSFFHILF